MFDKDYTVKIGQYISQGWSIFKQNPWLFIGFVILLGLVSGGSSQTDERISAPLNIILGPPISASAYIVAFKLIKNQETSFGDLFKGFQYFIPLVLASLLSGIFIILGMALLIIPGIYLAIAYSFVNQLIIDRNLGFWQAMETSRKIITKQWFSFLGLVLILSLINIVGLIPVGLGLFVTVPLTICTLAVAYDDIVGVEKTSF